MRNNGYIDGFIHITYYNHNITSEENSDDVELMWIGLLRMTLEYLENGKNQHKARKSNIVQYKKQTEKIRI
ncbi:hypothetical protein AAHH67_19615 [Niallia circulans]